MQIKDIVPKEYRSDLEKISTNMPVMIRGIRQFSKRNSHTTTSLMSLQMIDMGPYRVLRQILSQIERKQTALKEACFKSSKKQLWIKEIMEKGGVPEDLDKLKMIKYSDDIESSKRYIKACINEIGALQQRYYEVIENNGIDPNWTEKDFEEEEIKHHIKCIFRNALRDRMAKNCNMGTMEYMEQFGIEPVLAYAMADKFLESLRLETHQGADIDISARYRFYDKVYEVFKDEYKKPMQRLGLNSIVYADWLMKEEI